MSKRVSGFRPTSVIPIGLLLLGLSFLIMGFVWIDYQCRALVPGGFDRVCFIPYPNWFVVPAIAFLLVGAGSLIWFYTKSRGDRAHEEADEREKGDWHEGPLKSSRFLLHLTVSQIPPSVRL